MLSRHYSNAARQTAQVAEKVSRLENGLTVASVDLQGVTSQLVIAFRAGSRYEKVPGTTHVARNAVGKDTHDFPGVSLIWNSGNEGANLSSFSTRDVFAVSMSVNRDKVPVALSVLGEVAAQPAYKPWDIEEVKPTIAVDHAQRCPKQLVMEDLHRAAYRNGSLGNSIYAGKASKVGFADLEKFAAEHFVAGNAVVVGVNVEHESVLEYATRYFKVADGAAKQPAAGQYFGGEFRREGAGASHVALAGEGAGLNDLKAVAVQAVVAQLLETAAKKAGLAASAVNVSYADAGLVGVQIVAGSDAAAATQKLAQVIKGAKADEAAVKSAAKTAAVNVLVASEDSANVAIDRAIQLLSTSSAASPAEFAEAVSKVSAQDVSAALSKLNKKLAMSVYGNVRSIPYVDQL